MSDIESKATAEQLLSAPGEQLAAAGQRYELVDEELTAAARWSRSHDPSEGYAQVLGEVLTHMGVKDVDLGS